MEKFEQKPKGDNRQENKATLENLQSNISQTKKALENGELKPEKKKKLARVLGKFLKAIRNIALAGSVLAVANHERTHDDLNIETVGSEKVYTHPDAQTTHILNVLAGKESVTEDDILLQIRYVLEHLANEAGIKLEKSALEMSLDELDATYATLKPNSKPGEVRAVFEEQMEVVKEDSEYLREEGKEKEIYELIWKMEKECGNPRIRFTSQDIGFTPFESFEGNSHYDPVNNIVYMDMARLSDNMSRHQDKFFGEMAHAKQFNDQQIGTYLEQVSDFIYVFRQGGFNVDKLSESYHDLYETSGTVEHEAHSIIEPYLREKYGKYFIDRNEKKELESHEEYE